MWLDVSLLASASVFSCHFSSLCSVLVFVSVIDASCLVTRILVYLYGQASREEKLSAANPFVLGHWRKSLWN